MGCQCFHIKREKLEGNCNANCKACSTWPDVDPWNAVQLCAIIIIIRTFALLPAVMISMNRAFCGPAPSLTARGHLFTRIGEVVLEASDAEPSYLCK